MFSHAVADLFPFSPSVSFRHIINTLNFRDSFFLNRSFLRKSSYFLGSDLISARRFASLTLFCSLRFVDSLYVFREFFLLGFGSSFFGAVSTFFFELRGLNWILRAKGFIV